MAVHRTINVFFFRPDQPAESLQICRVGSFHEARQLIAALDDRWHVGYAVSRSGRNKAEDMTRSRARVLEFA